VSATPDRCLVILSTDPKIRQSMRCSDKTESGYSSSPSRTEFFRRITIRTTALSEASFLPIIDFLELGIDNIIAALGLAGLFFALRRLLGALLSIHAFGKLT
jgi:hypothetical protein